MNCIIEMYAKTSKPIPSIEPIENQIEEAQLKSSIAVIENGDGSSIEVNSKIRKISVQNYQPLSIYAE